MSKVSIQITRNQPPGKWTVCEHGTRIGIIKCADWVGLPDPGMSKLLPSAQPVQDQAGGISGRGNDVPVFDNWWRHIRRINTDRGYELARSVGTLWINIDYVPENKTPMSASVRSAFNLVAWTEERNGYYKILSFSKYYDTATLSAADNWSSNPLMFWALMSYNSGKQPFKCWGGTDCFVPSLANTETWMHSSYIEPFPTGLDYEVRGMKVRSEGQMLIDYIDGKRVFPTNWKINTPSVIPPIRWN